MGKVSINKFTPQDTIEEYIYESTITLASPMGKNRQILILQT